MDEKEAAIDISNFPINAKDPIDVTIPENWQYECYKQAAEFEEAEQCLLEKVAEIRKTDKREAASKFVSAIAVNSAFSLELYLKCLLHIDRRKMYSIHQLVCLFKQLSPKRKDQIEKLYAAEHSTGESLTKILEESDTAFEDWRYKFEGIKSKIGTGRYAENMTYSASVLIKYVKIAIKQSAPASLLKRLNAPHS